VEHSNKSIKIKGDSMTEPIRVAQMMTDMNYGGVEMVVMNYYRHIDRTKVQFDFFALEGSAVPQREEIERLGGRVYIVPKYTHLSAYEKEIIRLFKQNQYKIVHSHMNTLSVFSLWGAKKAGIPNRIAHNHSTAGKGETKKNIIKYALRPFAKIYPTKLCACSQYAGEWLYGKNTEFQVFNNAIDLSRYSYDPQKAATVRKELGLEDKLVVGHIGRFCYQKNHDFLIDIFNEIHKQRQEAVLLLIGEGELEQDIRNKVKELGLEDSVRFMGKQKDTSEFYQAMDCFVLPSRYEGLGVVAIEAQACSVPVICSTAVPKDAKITSSVKFIGLDESSSNWADCVLDVIKTQVKRNEREEVRKAGYDIEVEAQKLTDFYEELLK
jgi:glycosyltransferase involved in cell wall biosynthesis